MTLATNPTQPNKEAARAVLPHRRHGVMSRYEYNQRAYELARRGNQIKHAKLNPEKVAMIRKLREDRERIREWVSANYSDEALARRFGVSASAIYRVGNYIDWVSA